MRTVNVSCNNRCISGLLTANHPEFLDFRDLAENALLLHAWGFIGHLSFNAPSWSISAEWLLYLIFPLLLLAARRLSLVTNLLLVVASVAAMSLLRNEMGLRSWTEATYDFGMLRAVPTFFLGVIFAIILKKYPSALRVPWPFVHLLFLSAIAVLQFWPLRELSIAMLAMVVPLAAIAERGNRPSIMTTGVMARLGDASYAVYLIHVLAGIPVVFVLRRLHEWGEPIGMACAAATYVLVVIAGHLIYRNFESPLRRLLSGRSTRGAVAGLVGK